VVDEIEKLKDFFTNAKWLGNFPGIVQMIRDAKEEEQRRLKPKRLFRI